MQETEVRSLGWEDSRGVRSGNALQHSCLENPMDREAWRATVQGVTESQTRLSDLAHGTSSLEPQLKGILASKPVFQIVQ